MNLKSSFAHFKEHNLKWLYIPWLPEIDLLDERDYYLKRYPEAWGYYDSNSNKIFIIKEHDCLALRCHEYGHWVNARLFMFFDALWELPWWGLGLRWLFERKRNKGVC